jgi:hypothetical protein
VLDDDMADIWDRVDEYVTERLIGADPALDAALADSAAAGLPAIQVSARRGSSSSCSPESSARGGSSRSARSAGTARSGWPAVSPSAATSTP